MRYSAEHRELTRERILTAASARVRSQGLKAVSIADIMGDVGLTHGGFYWHFSSREDLLAAAIEHGAEETLALLVEAAASGESRDARLQAILDVYLSPQHRDATAEGCVAAALAVDVARADDQLRTLFTAALVERIALLTDCLGTGTKARQTALATLSMMVGALILARGVNQKELSTELLNAAKAASRELRVQAHP